MPLIHSTFRPMRELRRLALLSGAAVLLWPSSFVEAQKPFQLRVGGSSSALGGYDYANLELGGAWMLDLLFPGTGGRLGLGVEYAEYPIADEEERVVVGAADLILMTGGPLYLEFRGGAEVQGWDEPGVRYVTRGLRGGGGLGVQVPLGGVALDLSVFGNYFLGLYALANGEEVGFTESGPRFGVRAAVVLPGGAR